MIGLIGSMAVEMERLMAQVQERRETRVGMDVFVSGKLYGVEAVLAVCGPGKVNAALCTQSMILTFQPKWVLNLGVAGAGKPGMAIGDLVVATHCVQHDIDTTAVGDPIGLVSRLNLVELPCDAALRKRLVKAAAAAPGAAVYEGVIATGDQFINSEALRQTIHDRFGSAAVEMEGGAVAQVCYTHGIPCGVIRSISDKADGHSDMDYPTFMQLAAGHTQTVVARLLSELDA